MDIVVTKLYEKQLKDILASILKHDYNVAKHFKMYLDTLILNIASKEKKYKKSIYFDDENIKDLEYQGCVVAFYVDNSNSRYVILGITTKN